MPPCREMLCRHAVKYAALQRGIGKSRLKRIEKAGHMLNWEVPETIAEVIQSIGTDTKVPVKGE
jgi:pimeloyl-ACP methyl ester carboxylesterase